MAGRWNLQERRAREENAGLLKAKAGAFEGRRRESQGKRCKGRGFWQGKGVKGKGGREVVVEGKRHGAQGGGVNKRREQGVVGEVERREAGIFREAG